VVEWHATQLVVFRVLEGLHGIVTKLHQRVLKKEMMNVNSVHQGMLVKITVFVRKSLPLITVQMPKNL